MESNKKSNATQISTENKGQELEEFKQILDKCVPSNFVKAKKYLSFSFSANLIKTMIKKETEPFAGDMEFLTSFLSIFTAKKKLFQLNHKIEKMNSLPEKIDKYELNDCLELLASLEKLIQYLETLMEQRISVHSTSKIPLPRIVRLVEKLKLSEKERAAISYLIICASGQFEFGKQKTHYEFSDMIRYSGMSYSEGLSFLSPSKTLYKENIIQPDEDDPLKYGVNVPYGTLCVLTGTNLQTEDLLKIDKTTLSSLIEEEGGSLLSQSADESISLKEKSSSQEPKEENSKEDIYEFLREQVEMEKKKNEEQLASQDEEVLDETKLAPFVSNVEYLSDHIEWIAIKIRAKNVSKELEEDLTRDVKSEMQLRELKAKERMLAAKCSKRLEFTFKTKWMPRLEKLAKKLDLSELEKYFVLTLAGNTLSYKISPWNNRYGSTRYEQFTVGGLLGLFCNSFEEEINARHYFYKNATLVSDGIVKLADNSWGSELVNIEIELDRRMLDFIVGLDTELSELVEGSHIYTPQVNLDQVVLPSDQKNLIIETVSNFDHFKKARKKLGFDDTISYGSGMLLLFFGKSGTGKTLMANAVAKHLGKRILLVNYPSLGSNNADLVIKYIFREAKLQDAVLFFDECENMFLSRDKGGSIQLLLTEIERHSGLIIMATNRAFDLDEAMHRRITLAIEFRQPDHLLRSQIWQSLIPKSASFDSKIDWKYLSLKYELSGGFIKNAILSALSSAVSRDKENIHITQEDLEKGALHQLRGRLAMVDFDRRVIPNKGLDGIIASKEILEKLQEIVNFEKARQVLFGEWGFSEGMFEDQGTSCLFYGPPGTGKTLAAKAIGFETGKPLKIVNCAQLVSKWVGETGKNIETVFKEARTMDAILVFDEAEGLFGARSSSQESSTDRYANLDTGLLLYHMERFPGIVILTSNMFGNIDPAFFRRLRFVLEFTEPDASIREKLWRAHVPSEAPLSKDVDFSYLAQKFSFSGGHIKNCCFKAAAKAALRFDSERVISLKDLVSCAEEEEKAQKTKPPESLYL